MYIVKKVCGAGWNIVVGENPSTGREESSKQKSKQRKMCQDTGLLRLLYPLSYRTLKAQTQVGLNIQFGVGRRKFGVGTAGKLSMVRNRTKISTYGHVFTAYGLPMVRHLHRQFSTHAHSLPMVSTWVVLYPRSVLG